MNSDEHLGGEEVDDKEVEDEEKEDVVVSLERAVVVPMMLLMPAPVLVLVAIAIYAAATAAAVAAGAGAVGGDGGGLPNTLYPKAKGFYSHSSVRHTLRLFLGIHERSLRRGFWTMIPARF